MAELSPLERASQDHLADCRFRNLSRKTIAHYKQYEGSFIGFLRSQNTSLHLRSLNAGNVKTCAEWIRGRHGGKRDGQVATNAFVGTMKSGRRGYALKSASRLIRSSTCGARR